MARRRRRQQQSQTTPPSEAKQQDEDDKSQSSSSIEEEEPPPQPVSSDSEVVDQQTTTRHQQSSCSSRLFTPYRSLGVISSQIPFDYCSHDNSNNSMICVPIDNCFQLVRLDKLQPVLVSQRIAASRIDYCVTDASLSCTLVAHSSHTITLFHRTQPITSRRISGGGPWKIQQLLHLGRMTVAANNNNEKETENAMIVAAILSKQPSEEQEVPIVGDESSDDSEADDDDDCLGQVVLVLATRTKLMLHKRIRLSEIPTFSPTTALHPATYLNKIVLGGCYYNNNNNNGHRQAALILLNVRSGQIIHKFQCLSSQNDEDAYVTTLEQSPAVDTIAVGTNQGKVYLINTRHDKVLFSLKHQSKSKQQAVSIRSISFRTDASALQYNIAPMAVGRSDGIITIWDLTKDKETKCRTILCEIDNNKTKGIGKIQYVPQEPLLLVSGSNAILMYIFDNPDHSARLLKSRIGHSSPPACIRYLQSGGILANSVDGTDARACQILSSGGDDRTLRVFSTARSVLDKEYSQGKGLEKRAKQLGIADKTELLLPPVTAMAVSESRSRDWGDLVTIHQDHAMAYVWSTKRGAQSGPVLRQSKWNVSAMKAPPPPTTHATTVAMSPCGNICLVGTRGGIIYKYNVQSGNPRGSYPRDATEDQEEKRSKPKVAGDVKRTMKALERKMKLNTRASNLDKSELDAEQEAKLEERMKAKLQAACHKGHAVTGIAVDSLNKIVVSVGTDAKLILWNFSTHAPHKKSPYILPCPATKMAHVRESDLAAVALDDFSVVLFDCTAQSIVRRFGTTSAGHSGPISDLGFSPDGRSLFTASLDSTLRVWDVPTSTCIDWLSFKSPPTSLAISPTGEFLATTHSDRLGISIWSDRSYYQTIHVDGAPITEPARMDDPMPMAETLGTSSGSPAKATSIVETRKNKDEKEKEGKDKVPVAPKESGLITLSGLPPAHWKNLFHLELVKERNKPKEPPKKPPSAPFFLQWRSGEPVGGDAAAPDADKKADENADNDEDEWAAAWSDDEFGKGDIVDTTSPPNDERKREAGSQVESTKRRKIRHYRSFLASLLEQCSEKSGGSSCFQPVTDHIASLGPSAIDVELSSLCSGMHDLEEGLALLQMACSWLLEASQSRERFEAVNAYIHRFLHLHATVIAGIDDNFRDGEVPTEEELREKEVQREQRAQLLESISQLRQAQQAASEALRAKMQNTLCLLRHFSRMV